MRLDEQAHHCDILNTFKVKTETVDLAEIEGKKMDCEPVRDPHAGWFEVCTPSFDELD